ncbi:S-layer homology domain-containing protein [Cohnella sp. GbtcB17]|uniref:S-layer homology domain-containing protein n=1 Tax=Cohnella sp. GbtcB17 TaxID=2824762 RepID=UPI001C3034FE|nr:S-layer homology domain-containing protein [Cohnella sp. GbtcB17]
MTQLTYTDQAQLPGWAKESVLKAAALKKEVGYADGTFRPLAKAKYADAVNAVSGLWVASK